MLSRRKLLIAGVTVLGAGLFYAGDGQNLIYSALSESVTGEVIDAPTAHRLAESGDLFLIDIRRPNEWEKTGSGEGATRLDMRREDFIAELDKIIGGDRSKPVALICARGVRSSRMNNRLVEAGFTNVIDVSEGMLGSAAGPGWLKRELPVVLDKE